MAGVLWVGVYEELEDESPPVRFWVTHLHAYVHKLIRPLFK